MNHKQDDSLSVVEENGAIINSNIQDEHQKEQKKSENPECKKPAGMNASKTRLPNFIFIQNSSWFFIFLILCFFTMLVLRYENWGKHHRH